MRPYLAIIVDSFWEALASRVLWILLILITLVLLILFPLGYRQQRTTEFRRSDFVDARLGERHHVEHRKGDPAPGRRIWDALDEQTRAGLKSFEDASRENDGRSYREGESKLVEGLNGLLQVPDLYRAEDWQDAMLGNEARELLELETDALSADDLATFEPHLD